MRLRILSYFFIAVLVPVSANSQSAFLNRGESGLGFSINYKDGQGANSLDLEITSALGAIVDLELLLGVHHADEIASTKFGYGFGLEIYPLREGKLKIIPVSLSCFAQGGWADTLEYGSFGISIHKRLLNSKTFFIQPSLTYYKTWSADHRTGAANAIGFAPSLAYLGLFTFYLSPMISRTSNETLFELKIGVTGGMRAMY